MFRVGQVVKIDERFKNTVWYIPELLRIIEIDDNELIKVDITPISWNDNEINLYYLVDATEEYRQETIKKILCSE